MRHVVLAATLSTVAGLAGAMPALAQDAGSEAAPADAAAHSAMAATEPALPVIALAAPAAAEVPAAKPRAAMPMLEEIIVTAQRREENLQDVPISITVFNQEQLSNANITNSADLATYTPSLTTNSRFGSDNASFSIRGFTQDLRTTASVGVYFAEVVAPRGQSLQTSGDGAGPGSLFDLQSVQVLKGPQGTLFGRNTTGGAVLLVPQKPKHERGGYLEASAGNFDARRVQAVGNLPLGERFRIRLGLDHNQREGHLHNITGIGADDLANVDYTALRASAVFDISENIENYTILTYVDSDNNGATAQLFACNPSLNPLNNPLYALTGNGCRDQLNAQAASGQDGFYDVVSTLKTPVTQIEELRAINTTTWRISDTLTFKNIIAYAHLETLNSSEVFGTQFRALYDPNPERLIKVGLTVLNPDYPVTSQQTWVEELQLQGSAFDDRLNWLAGAYYEHSTPDGVSGNNSATLLSCEPASLEGQPEDYNCFDGTVGAVGSVRSFAFKTDYLNQAVFTQASYELLDPLSLTAGIRYTWDRTKGRSLLTRYEYIGPVQQPPAVVRTSPSVKSEAVTGVVNLDYKPVDNVMLYAKYARGYRQGSINMASDPGLDTFDPEQVDTYEVGAKTRFGGWLPGRFNFAVFYNDFTDMQLQTGYVSPNVGSTTAIFNAGEARIAGAEVEAFFQLSERISLNLSYSHLDTELLEQDDKTLAILAAAGPQGALTVTPIADVGDSLPFAPDHTVVSTLAYRVPLPERLGALDASATYVYIGEQRATATSSSPFAVMDAYSLLNLNLNWMHLFELPLDLSLFATNVLDEEYVTYVSGTYNVLGFESRNTGLPRMIGARLRYHFGADAR